ncbi:MAG: PIN domain-containing protein [Hyphomicrobiales bacterium]|nr:PIN domain-containing protein [Hyphomicrobiales bacterium]
MALRYMLDTNTCVRVLKANTTSTLAGRLNRHAEQICISSIVLAELHFGAENSRHVAENLIGIENFVARLGTVLSFDAAAAADFGRIKVALRKSRIGPLDTLIAAHARSHGLIIVTANIGEFGRVPGLAVEDWQ